MPRLTTQNPSYRRHKKSGQAVVTLNGKDHYLGPHGTKASRQEYDRLIAEWWAGGRRLNGGDNADLTITELINDFRKHAEVYYRKPDGTPTGEAAIMLHALRPLVRLYGRTFAADFGPLALKAVAHEMIQLGWCRSSINRHLSRIKHVFKWAVANEMIPSSAYHALQAFPGLRAGRTEAKESEPVTPVADAIVTATLAHVSPQVRAMIELQLLTGMRPGEVVSMRSCDVEMTTPLWTYRPSTHKTQHHGHARTIYLGPKAQAILQPFLRHDLQAFLFSPSEAEAARREALRAARKTPLSCGNVPGSNRKRSPKRQAGDGYDVVAYRRAIARACDRAFPPPADLAKGLPAEKAGEKLAAWRSANRWHPHQLRHNAATALRKEFGLEAAQVILGHKTLAVTEIYAEKNVAAAQRIMADVG